MILLLSTSDTDLLSARSSGAEFRLANPARLDLAELPALLDGAPVVLVRILGSQRSWQQGLDLVRASGAHVVVLGGEQSPDAELMALSTVPVGIATQAHAYLAQGGPDNLAQLHRFLSDTLLLTGHGFEPPVAQPLWGALHRTPRRDSGPVVAVLYYRAHHLSGNTGFVHTLCAAIEDAGAQALPLYCASLRSREPGLLAELRRADALLVTVLAAGGTRPSAVGAGGDDEAWDVAELAALDIPILQALCLTSDRESWRANDDGLSPVDAGSQVAVPEFDGRLITVPFSFKEIDDEGLPRYVPDPERAARVAGIAVAHARLRHTPPPRRRIALMLSAYPTKHSRVGNAVGLDTPASAVLLLRRMRELGYDLGAEPFPGVEPTGTDQPDGDALIHALIAAGGQDPEWLSEEQLAGNPIRVPAARYRRWFDALPEDLRADVERHWGPPPGELYVDRSADPDGEIVLAALRAGNVVLMIQPPRGFGENPVAIYHNPDLPPSHHYLAAYRWLAEEFGAHAVVHLGKHGSLEWLPGKTVGLSASCAPDAVLGDLPLVYPFLVNDPGEGAQAKRRAHATIVDHLIPPMARAESYGDLARLEQLLDEHANIAAMDPAKLPAIRAQIWTLIQAAKLDHDLGVAERPHDAEFDDFLLHIDGWLCEVKDAQIRDGLHVLGQAPTGAARVNLVLAVLRAQQMWGGQAGAVPGLRSALGLKENSDAPLSEVDAVERTARALVEAMEARDWSPRAVPAVCAQVLAGGAAPAATPQDSGYGAVAQVLTFAATEIVPRLAGTSAELDAVLHALDGGYVPAGPSGSPLRGLVNVLPTGRNFYTVDPKAVPSRLAWETGQALADSLLRRYREDTGDWPRSVGLSVWGTSAMRTSGDDAAEVLALLGVQPVWDEASRRVTGLEPIPLAELGRPRIDVTVRISGFFRDAFPHVIDLLDDAVRLVAALPEPESDNFVRAHTQADLAAHGDERRATTRIFGSKPGAYGAGLLPLMDSGNWRDDADLAEVYATWGGYAYGRDLDGRPARADMENSYRRIVVAAKNTDTREHDIIDSDDYFQYHGGMIAFTRALTGRAPASYVGDSTTPDAVRTRSLAEETARVFRARVVNPRWLAAMRRHGYKGAFELAATVDYLFGFDATAGVVRDWMYEKLAQSYVLDQENQEFMASANPWALRGIIERLTEAADRGLWAEPDPDLIAALHEVYLRTEGDLEGP
ncbi:cobaltochelatase subunit CobN [Goodfellowiella coeruleoviolacea]|uniref:Cobaltochelatase CobN n=1 Tax=Goodfellowiella coeruleoviolacea TaxID=334858 RepID=A0AAE3KE24_9PSEU|nr:cobaltochelatase subunit CobN [Goodfellowiella coeruleoviolacea]MCP2163370.1 cobaltochelatase CobN [Goodfellowiella coeruleoviolacea]